MDDAKPKQVEDDELVMMSALQHYCFCPRQCALIHVENIWHENFLTASGRQLHERVDKRGTETRVDVKNITSLRLVSHRLGVMGMADMVELHRNADGVWHAYPVEYKHGKPKEHRADEVQLCAQAMALEEMRGEAIEEGALFYGTTRRRVVIKFDEELRRLTGEIAAGVCKMIREGKTPPAEYTKACESCSLYDECRPKEMCGNKSANEWISKQLKEVGV